MSILHTKLRRGVRRAVQYFGYDVIKQGQSEPEIDFLSLAVGLSLASPERLRVVQVGANDGCDTMRDVVRRTGARALLIEPNPELISSLRSNYDGVDGVEIQNVAIDNRTGSRVLYQVSGQTRIIYKKLGLSATGISSFDRAHLEKHIRHFIGAPADNSIKEVPVSTVPLFSLVLERGFSNAQILQIDAEGHDFEILKTAALDKWKPSIICMEISHAKTFENSCREYLLSYGYSLLDSYPDMIAIKNNS